MAESDTPSVDGLMWLVLKFQLIENQTDAAVFVGHIRAYAERLAASPAGLKPPANCPTNGGRINYTWRIDSKAVLMVEAIVAVVESVESGEPAFHEDIADHLAARFEGEHTLTAYHHGVLIETNRTHEPSR